MLLGSRSRQVIPGLQDMSKLAEVGDINLQSLPDFNGPRVLDKKTGKAEWTDTGIKGALQRAGDFLGSDQGRAALLRSGAATLEGGLSAGIAAGTGYMEHERAREAGAEQQSFENQLAALRQQVAQQQADQTGEYQQGQLGNERDRNAVQFALGREQNVNTRLGHEISRANSRDQTGLGYARIAEDGRVADQTSADRRYATDSGYETSIFGDRLRYLGSTGGAAGIGSKDPGYTETVTKVPATSEGGFIGIGAKQHPAQKVTTRVPLAAAGHRVPSDAAIQFLKTNPNTASAFEAMHGPGTAAQYLGGR